MIPKITYFRVDTTDTQNQTSLRTRQISLDSGTYRVKRNSVNVLNVGEKKKLADKVIKLSKRSDTIRDVSPVWIERRRCCSANQTLSTNSNRVSTDKKTADKSTSDYKSPTPHSRALWFVSISSQTERKEDQRVELIDKTIDPLVKSHSRRYNPLSSKSESHLLLSDISTSASRQPNRSSLRLKKHKLKNNKFTYSKYLAQKDNSETDFLTKSSVSLTGADNMLADSMLPDDALITCNIITKDKPMEDCKSFVDTYISLDATDMELRSVQKSCTQNTTHITTTTADLGDKISPGDRRSPRGRSKSPGNTLSSKSPGNTTTTTDLFMRVSNRLSTRLSLSRKHRKPSIPVETSAQTEIENYLYGKESSIEVNYTDLNYTANNYTS